VAVISNFESHIFDETEHGKKEKNGSKNEMKSEAKFFQYNDVRKPLHPKA
jgi:hypothetical protein